MFVKFINLGTLLNAMCGARCFMYHIMIFLATFYPVTEMMKVIAYK